MEDQIQRTAEEAQGDNRQVPHAPGPNEHRTETIKPLQTESRDLR